MSCGTDARLLADVAMYGCVMVEATSDWKSSRYSYCRRVYGYVCTPTIAGPLSPSIILRKELFSVPADDTMDGADFMRGYAELGRDEERDGGGRAPWLVYERLLAADDGRLPYRSDRKCSSEFGLCTCGKMQHKLSCATQLLKVCSAHFEGVQCAQGVQLDTRARLPRRTLVTRTSPWESYRLPATMVSI